MASYGWIVAAVGATGIAGLLIGLPSAAVMGGALLLGLSLRRRQRRRKFRLV